MPIISRRADHMNTREAYYLHVQGEQKGPYTLRQLDHQLHTGLIAPDTLYWAEDMEQWHPITDLIPMRQPRRPWRTVLIVLLISLPIGAIVTFFGPTVRDGWREQTQREYTPKAAYWAARGVVRSELAQKNVVPDFLPQSAARVEMTEENSAMVTLEGRLLGDDAKSTPATWKVRLHFDPTVRTWSAVPINP